MTLGATHFTWVNDAGQIEIGQLQIGESCVSSLTPDLSLFLLDAPLEMHSARPKYPTNIVGALTVGWKKQRVR